MSNSQDNSGGCFALLIVLVFSIFILVQFGNLTKVVEYSVPIENKTSYVYILVGIHDGYTIKSTFYDKDIDVDYESYQRLELGQKYDLTCYFDGLSKQLLYCTYP